MLQAAISHTFDVIDLSFRIVKILIELGKSLGCYKITLNCTDKMIAFYQRLGFVAEQGNANFLVIRVPPTQTS